MCVSAHVCLPPGARALPLLAGAALPGGRHLRAGVPAVQREGPQRRDPCHPRFLILGRSWVWGGCPPGWHSFGRWTLGSWCQQGGAKRGFHSEGRSAGGFRGAVALRMGTGNGGIPAWLLTFCRQTGGRGGRGGGKRKRGCHWGSSGGGRGAEGQGGQAGPPAGEGEEVPRSWQVAAQALAPLLWLPHRVNQAFILFFSPKVQLCSCPSRGF